MGNRELNKILAVARERKMELEPSSVKGPHKHPGHLLETPENVHLKSRGALVLEKGYSRVVIKKLKTKP